jgi:hypothetical protein
MGEEAFAGLAAQLRADPPPGLRALDSDQLSDLTTAVRDARRRQAAELQAAGDKAYGHIPRLLRGPIRKIAG